MKLNLSYVGHLLDGFPSVTLDNHHQIGFIFGVVIGKSDCLVMEAIS